MADDPTICPQTHQQNDNHAPHMLLPLARGSALQSVIPRADE